MSTTINTQPAEAGTAVPWAFLDQFRGTLFEGDWPTLPQLFAITTQRFPEAAAFTVYEPNRVTLTYAEAYGQIRKTANYLRSIGVEHGDRVAVTGKNSPEWAVAYLAILHAGAVVVPIDYQLHDKETSLLMTTAGATVVFVDEEKYDACAANARALSLSPKRPNYIYELSAAVEYPINPARSEEPAAILFTSGTTGRPKGVMLSHRNFVADCFLAQANLTVLQTDVFYALLPIHHSYCMLAVFIESFSVGAELVFGKRLVIKQVLQDLRTAKVTMFLGVPLLFNKLIAGILRGVREKGVVAYAIIRSLMAVSGLIKKVFHLNPGKKLFHSVLEKASLSTIRICISGGGPLAPSVFRRYNQLGIDFVQGYGLTETSPILTINPIDHYKETSVGKVLPQVEMKIIDPDERGAGEVVVKGPMVMMGYYRMPEETAAVFTPDGYFKTGDIGYLDGENYLYLTGRAKNMIVTGGGKNVYPEEIENAFQLYDQVDQVLVRGYLPDPKDKIEAIEVLIYPNRDAFGDAGSNEADGDSSARIEARIKEIVAEVNKELHSYQKIERITILKEPMQMTTTKKIIRHSVQR